MGNDPTLFSTVNTLVSGSIHTGGFINLTQQVEGQYLDFRRTDEGGATG